jgi:serine/threonine-protein kinase SRPK3
MNFGEPETEEVVTRTHSPLGPSLPARLFAPIDNAHLTNAAFLKEDALLIDFGQSFPSSHPPTNYEPATIPHYLSPEARFDGKMDMSSDIWALACTIFEIRAGFPLFEVFIGGPDEILKEIVATLGKLPEPWWGAFENRHLWFDEDGMPKERERQQTLLPAEKTSIEQKLASIGSGDMPPATGTDGPMIERPGTRLDGVEIQLLRDLLEKMLRYLPQERINISEVVSHPWFTLE